MTPADVIFKYDNRRNALTIIFSGVIDSVADAESKIEAIMQNLLTYTSDRKIWIITDYTNIRPSGLSVANFAKLTKKKLVGIFQEKTLGRIAIMNENPNVTIFVKLFGNLIGTKAYVCKTYEEAIILLDKLIESQDNSQTNS